MVTLVTLLSAASPSPPPTPATVVVSVSKGAPGWTVWLPTLAALLALAGVLVTAWLTYRHNRRALDQKVESDRSTLAQTELNDRRERLWDRLQWAMDKMASTDPRERVIGFEAAVVLQGSKLATDEDRDMLDKVADAYIRLEAKKK